MNLLTLILISCMHSFAAGLKGKQTPPFELASLPYEHDALEPHIGSETLAIHHGKHHAKYVRTLNTMVQENPEYSDQSIVSIIKASRGSNQGVFNNAAQSWNHEFYWNSMTPEYEEPSESLVKALEASFDSFDNFKNEFAKAGNTAFGSGWAWLVYDTSSNDLIVMNTIGADNPFAINDSYIPILVMDVWEHAYYLDYQNRRDSYTSVFLKKLVNWEFVEQNLKHAMQKDEAEL